MSIWVSEITEENLKVITSDGFSPWPLDNDKEWFGAQKWRNLTNDMGRIPLDIRDNREDCEQVKDQCETDLWGVRAACAKTCHVYMEDEEYYAFLETLKLKEQIAAATTST